MALLESLLGLRGKMQGYSEAAKMQAMQRLGVDDYYLKLMQAQEQARGQVQNQLAADAEQRQLRQQAELLKPVLNKYGPDAAKQMGSLLLSNSPEARAYGSAQLMGAEVSRGTAPQSVLDAQQARTLANTAAGQQVTQQGIMGPLEQQTAEANLLTAQRQAQMAGQPQVSFDAMKQITDRSLEVNGINENIRSASTLADIWEQFSGIDAKRNPELAGKAAAAALGTIPALQAMFNSGTLNEGEKEYFQDLIADPSSLWQRLSTRDGKAIAFLREIAAREKRRKGIIKDSPIGQYLVGGIWEDPASPYALPPGTVIMDLPNAGMSAPTGNLPPPSGGMGPVYSPGILDAINQAAQRRPGASGAF